MEQQPVGKLVRKVARLSPSALRVIVHDQPGRTLKHGDRREGSSIDAGEVPDHPRGVLSQGTERQDWDREVLGKGPGVQRVSQADAEFLANLPGDPVRLALEPAPQSHCSYPFRNRR